MALVLHLVQMSLYLILLYLAIIISYLHDRFLIYTGTSLQGHQYAPLLHTASAKNQYAPLLPTSTDAKIQYAPLLPTANTETSHYEGIIM